MDNSRVVRIEINQILFDLMNADKKQFTPIIMKILIGPWWISTCDPSKDVSVKAQSTFQSSIPLKKRDSVLAFLAPSLFSYIKSIINQNPQCLSDTDPLFKV